MAERFIPKDHERVFNNPYPKPDNGNRENRCEKPINVSCDDNNNINMVPFQVKRLPVPKRPLKKDEVIPKKEEKFISVVTVPPREIITETKIFEPDLETVTGEAKSDKIEVFL